MTGHEVDRIAERVRMVEEQLVARGVSDPAVLEAMAMVPREHFVPERIAHLAYEDSALPIDAGQTISQPFIVAEMAAAAELEPTSRVLEIGGGSGYGAAVLSRVAGEVWTIEVHQILVDQARTRLSELGYDNVHVRCGDGSHGWREEAPFDAVVVTAAAPSVPPELIDQLVTGGRLIMPVGPHDEVQQLMRLRRTTTGTDEENLGAVRFVPFV